MRGLRLALSIVLAFVLMMPAIATAKDTDAAGKVTAVQGKSEVKKSGGAKKFNAFKGMAIGKGDTILTGKDGKLTMSLGTDKEAVIGANTTLTVSELVKSASAMGGKTSISLSKGSVLIKIKQKLDGDSRFQIETPTAIMGVMGTEFTVSVEEGETYVGVFEGKVEARTGDDRNQTDYVLPDGQLTVDADGETTPSELNAEDLPLVALEYYAELLQSGGNADPELLKRVLELLKQKQAAAAEQAGQATPRPTTIIYGDEGAGGGGPAATPAPTPTPSPSQPPNPPQQGAPEFDSDAFYGDIYDYVINDTTIRIPFTRDLAFAEGVDAEENGWESYVELSMGYDCFECYEPERHTASISNIVLEGNELVLTLDEDSPINYGYAVWLEIAGNMLVNVHYPEDVQTNSQRIYDSIVEIGLASFILTEGYENEYPYEQEWPEWIPYAFIFKVEVPFELSFDASSGEYFEWFLPSLLGYAQPEELIVELWNSESQSEILDGRYEWAMVDGGGWVLRISKEVLNENIGFDLRLYLSQEDLELYLSSYISVHGNSSLPLV